MNGGTDTHVPRREAEWVIARASPASGCRRQAPSKRSRPRQIDSDTWARGRWEATWSRRCSQPDEYRNHAQPGDYTRSVIVGPASG